MYVKERNREKPETKLVQTLKTETGFDLICSSCLQYKSKHLCNRADILSKANTEKYLVKFVT